MCSSHVANNPIGEKYSIGEIRKIIEDKGGYVNRTIIS